MTSSIPGEREMPLSRFDLSTYWGRVRHSMDIADPSTLFVSRSGLLDAKNNIAQYKQGQIQQMNPQLWRAKKIVDSTLHPDTGEPVFLPFRMSCFVISNLVVTAGMLTPGLKTRGTIAWQVANQSLNVAINYSNANKSSPLTTSTLLTSYLTAVTASCGVAVGLNAIIPRLRSISPGMRGVLSRLIPFAAVASAGALNVILMRGQEMRVGIDVFGVRSSQTMAKVKSETGEEPTRTEPESMGKSSIAARHAVLQTALSRVLNATPIMVIPPLILHRLQQRPWLKTRPHMVLPVNLALILTTSIFALPLALGVFPQRQRMLASKLEDRFWDKVEGGREKGELEFNRGI